MQDLAAERAHGTFDVAAMRSFLDNNDPALTQRKDTIMLQLERDPVFATVDPNDADLSLAEVRERTMAKVRRFAEYVTAEPIDHFKLRMEMLAILDPGTWTRIGVHFGLFLGALQGQATPSQFAHWIAQGAMGLNGLTGCFAMTELGHGSNVAGLETTATFDPAADEFVVHTPTLTATKWWIGGAAQTATHAAVFAQLIVNGVNHGVKTLVVQLRDVDTFALRPGIRIGDIGAKMGRHGTDNGWIQFTAVRVPRSHLLMKHVHVARDGTVRSKSIPQLAYGALITGRVTMVTDAANVAGKALVIAVRYAAVRRQFTGQATAARADTNESATMTAHPEPPHGLPSPASAHAGSYTPPPPLPSLPVAPAETKILDYAIHQYRLMPLLAQAYAFRFTAREVTRMYNELMAHMTAAAEKGPGAGGRAAMDNLVDTLKEMHGTSAGLKAFCTWSTLHTIDTCRQACGGHGYSSYTGLASTYADFAVHCLVKGTPVLAIRDHALARVNVEDLATGDALLDEHGRVTRVCTPVLAIEAETRAITGKAQGQNVMAYEVTPGHLLSLRCEAAPYRIHASPAFGAARMQWAARNAAGQPEWRWTTFSRGADGALVPSSDAGAPGTAEAMASAAEAAADAELTRQCVAWLDQQPDRVRRGDVVDITADAYAGLDARHPLKSVFGGFRGTVVDAWPEPLASAAVPAALRAHHALLDPYFLGLWLGGGSPTSATIESAGRETSVLDRLRQFYAPLGFKVRSVHVAHRDAADAAASTDVPFDKVAEDEAVEVGGCWRVAIDDVSAPHTHGHRLREALDAFGLTGADGMNKHIPPAFLYAPATVRRQVLAGLCDSDAGMRVDDDAASLDARTPSSPEPTPVWQFTPSNDDAARLVDDVQLLGRSLGLVHAREVCSEQARGAAQGPRARASQPPSGQNDEGVVAASPRVLRLAGPGQEHVSAHMHVAPKRLAAFHEVSAGQRTRAHLEVAAAGPTEPGRTNTFYSFEVDGTTKRFLLADWTAVHNCTWEGDNTILTLQAGRYLVGCYRDANGLSQRKSKKNATPRPLPEGVAYLGPQSSASAGADAGAADLHSLAWIAEAFRRVAREAVRAASEQFEAALADAQARGAAQPEEEAHEVCSAARLLAARVHCAGYVFHRFHAALDHPAAADARHGLGPVLTDLCRLYGLHALATGDLPALLLQQGFLRASEMDALRAAVARLCATVRRHAVPLVDAFGLSDFMVNSPFGAYDGNVYERYFEAVRRSHPSQPSVGIGARGAVHGAAGGPAVPPYFAREIYPLLHRRVGDDNVLDMDEDDEGDDEGEA